MAVSGLAKELIDQRRKEVAEDGTRTYYRRWLVTCTDVEDDSNVALGAPGLPQRYFHYITATSFDLLARCTNISAVQANSPFHWFVEAVYSTTYGDQQQENEDPLLDFPEIEWTYETIQVPIVGTPDQNVVQIGSTAPFTGAVKSPAGEIYNPPPMMDESRQVVTITRNESQFNVQTAVLYANAVNSDTFFGVPPRCAKMRGLTARLATEKDKLFWRVTYTIAFKRDTWDLHLMNWGTVYLASATDTTPTQFKTTDGFPTVGFLGTDGTLRASTLSPTFTVYRIHKEQPFGALNLPLGPNRS